MKFSMRGATKTGAFLFLIYIIIYMIVSWRTGKSFTKGVTDREVVRRKLDRIEKTLNKLGEYQFRSNLIKELYDKCKVLAL